MKRAVFDTSYIMYCIEYHRDPLNIARGIEGVVDAYIPLYVIQEMHKLSRGRNRRARLAAVAAQVIHTLYKRGVKIIDPPLFGDVDTSLLMLAKRCGFVLLTADKMLKKRARRVGVEVYSPVSSKAGERIA